jgi:hypothetical protein
MKRKGHRSFQVVAMIAAFFVRYHRIPSLAAAEQTLTEQERQEGEAAREEDTLALSQND